MYGSMFQAQLISTILLGPQHSQLPSQMGSHPCLSLQCVEESLHLMITLSIDKDLLFCVAVTGISAIVWWLGHGVHDHPSISVPKWLLVLCGIYDSKEVDHKRFEIQMFAIVLLVWSIVLMFLESDQIRRNKLFAAGLVLEVIGVVLLDVYLAKIAGRPNKN